MKGDTLLKKPAKSLGNKTGDCVSSSPCFSVSGTSLVTIEQPVNHTITIERIGRPYNRSSLKIRNH